MFVGEKAFKAAIILFVLLPARGAEVASLGAPPGGRVQHRVAGRVSFLNPTTIRVDDFTYDGNGIRVYFYFYRPGGAQSGRGGTIIRANGIGDGRIERRAYNSEDLQITMPSGTDVCDIQTLTVWCDPFDAIFAQVTVDRSQVFVNNGADPCAIFGGDANLPELPPTSFDNCISFSNSLQLQWTVDTANNEVDFEICSCRNQDPSQNQYMGFGLSPRSDSTFMIGADATIAWLDNRNGEPNAVDYFITGRTQCRGGEGVCPDTLLSGRNCVNNIDPTKLTGGTRRGTQQCVTFSRNFTTGDSECDIDFTVNQNQYIVWAIGGLGETAFIHFDRSDSTSAPLLLNRTGDKSSCTNSPIQCMSCPPFSSNRMVLSTNATLRLTIGPSAQERGYMAITGQSGWGISWYVNGTLIPELVLTRGMTYTFIVEGGNDPSNLATYHPFYITDSISGGRLRNTPEEQMSERVFAGFDASGNPTGVGSLCQAEETREASTIRESCRSEQDYFNAIPQPNCSSGEPGKIVWTPDDSTPNTVYYQCATHLNLGWRINLTDSSSITPDSSVTTQQTATAGASDLSVTTNQQIDTAGAPSTIMTASMLVITLLSLLTYIIIH